VIIARRSMRPARTRNTRRSMSFCYHRRAGKGKGKTNRGGEDCRTRKFWVAAFRAATRDCSASLRAGCARDTSAQIILPTVTRGGWSTTQRAATGQNMVCGTEAANLLRTLNASPYEVAPDLARDASGCCSARALPSDVSPTGPRSGPRPKMSGWLRRAPGLSLPWVLIRCQRKYR
jgi:hypothetical protein